MAVLPNRAGAGRHPGAAATLAASTRVRLDLTGWIAETGPDALLRAPGRALIPTRQNAARLIDLADVFVADLG